MNTTSSDWDARTYHAVSSPQYNWGLSVLARLELKGDETVLDVGCGTGRLTQELLKRLPEGRVIALDVSESMLRTARETLGDDPRVELVHLDATKWKRGQAVDAVFSTATFHWILDHDALYAALYATLRPGGHLVAQCGGGPNLARIYARAEALIARAPFASHFAAWTEPWYFAQPAATEQRLTRAGFADIHVGLEAAPTNFPNADALREFLRTVVLRPFLSALPTADLQNGFLDAMVQHSAADAPPFLLDYWRLNISARS